MSKKIHDTIYRSECPHCQGSIEVKELNCQIFRHGVLKSNGQPISPHLPKAECDRLFQQKLIYGCGKPFRFNGHEIEKCDYI